jgi:fructose-1,6-bisphosphatase/inositol monophosphatase family enzyme
MLEHFNTSLEIEIKTDNSPVTIADKQINQLVLDAVAASYPGHSVRGEEGSNQKMGDEYVWVCDPIDGTIPFSLGIPTNVFSLALVKDGRPIIGVIYDPYLKRLYSAEHSRGAHLNGQAIEVNTLTSIDPHAIVGLSGPKSSLVDLIGLRSAVAKTGARIMIYTSCVYEGALVAAGHFVAEVFPGSTAHDVAALKIIIEEAGGRVTDLDGHDQRYDMPVTGLVASNGLVHNEMLSLVARFRPKP